MGDGPTMRKRAHVLIGDAEDTMTAKTVSVHVRACLLACVRRLTAFQVVLAFGWSH